MTQLFPYETVKRHYLYEPMRQSEAHPDIYINQIRFYRLYQYFKKCFPELFNQNTSIVDIGCTSGILLKAMNKTGTVININ
ncbi:hypothetical protein IID04_04320, partial [PVC group bacterium]|nr:hypothetical protein [PVC group bacterium]